MCIILGHVNYVRVSAVPLLTKIPPSHAQCPFDCSQVTHEQTAFVWHYKVNSRNFILLLYIHTSFLEISPCALSLKAKKSSPCNTL